MVRIAKYNIEIGAVSKGVNAAFRSLENRARRVRKNLLVALRFSVTNFLNLSTLTSQVTSLLNAVTGIGQFDALDGIGKTADNLGVSAEAYQVLQKAAELAGVENANFATGMRAITRRASEAAQGVESARAIFNELRIDPDQFVRSDTTSQIQQLSTAFQGVKNNADAVRLSLQLAEESGVGFLSIFRSGALDDAREFFDSIGGGISRSEIALVEQANDAWNKLVSTFRVLQQRVIVGVAPVLTALTERAQQFFAVLQSDFDVSKFVRGFAVISASIQDTINDVVDIGTVFIELVAKVLEGIRAIESVRLSVFGGSQEEFQALEKLPDQIRKLREAGASISAKIASGPDIRERVEQLLTSAQNAANASADRIVASTQTLEDVTTESVRKLRDTLAPSLVRGSAGAVEAVNRSRFDTTKIEKEEQKTRKVMERIERNTRPQPANNQPVNVNIRSTLVGV